MARKVCVPTKTMQRPWKRRKQHRNHGSLTLWSAIRRDIAARGGLMISITRSTPREVTWEEAPRYTLKMKDSKEAVEARLTPFLMPCSFGTQRKTICQQWRGNVFSFTNRPTKTRVVVGYLSDTGSPGACSGRPFAAHLFAMYLHGAASHDPLRSKRVSPNLTPKDNKATSGAMDSTDTAYA